MFFVSMSFANTLETNLGNQRSLEFENSLNYKKTFGHNMSGNSYTLKQGQCLFSTYVAACGVTDQILVGTSTWMLSSYNSHNLAFRYASDLNSKYRVGVQSIYMKSYDTSERYYEMETWRTQFILTNKIDSKLTHHYNLTYEYFYDETVPHSLRREPLNSDAYQVSLSNLFEYDFTDKYIIQYELGIHGVNYHYPQLLTGFSLGRRWINSFVQLGFSANGTAKSYFNTARIDSNSYAKRSRNDMRKDFSIHPEIQFQYFF